MIYITIVRKCFYLIIRESPLNNIKCYFTLITHAYMNNWKVRTGFNKFKIIYDSGYSSTIIMVNMMSKIKYKKYI